ncbi:MAG: DUF4339 domain-containing protein [Simkaniaceae bacterium]
MKPITFTMSPLFMILMTLVTATMTGYMARQRGRNPIIWFILGGLFGLFAFMTLLILSKKELEPAYPTPAFLPKTAIKPTPPPSPLWYALSKSGSQEGPMSLEALKDSLKKGQITPSTYIWNETMDDWERLKKVPDLNETEF